MPSFEVLQLPDLLAISGGNICFDILYVHQQKQKLYKALVVKLLSLLSQSAVALVLVSSLLCSS